ncbi:MAG: hypothetical protein RL021_2162 [Bacteroidota bacterium]
MTSQDNYSLLIANLDAFIRKYYKNRLIRGGIYAFTLSLAFFLLVTSLEWAGRFDITLRTVLFYVFLSGIVFILYRFVAVPIGHLYRIGNVISHKQAAHIIGTHFSEVADKLLNVLQLKEQSDRADTAHRELIEASIAQKSNELRPIPFSSAVNVAENKRYLRWALIPFSVLILLLFTAPSLITDSTRRLIEHRTYFGKPAPFSFVVLNKELKAIQQADFRLDVKMEGREVPSEVFIEIEDNLFRLEKEDLTSFHYTFRNLQGSIDFRLYADGFYSKQYRLEALPNPTLLNFKALLVYSPYLNKRNETLENTGDLTVPAGTRVTWSFTTRNTETLRLVFSDTTIALQPTEEGRFTYTRRCMRSDSYRIVSGNRFMESKDSMAYVLTVVADQYPSISVEQQQDSISSKRRYFRGVIKDDYGFSKLQFVYRLIRTDDTTGRDRRSVTQPLPVNRSLNADAFFHFWDLSRDNIQAGDEVEYYFEVFDNDGVSGPKSMRSQTLVFKAPSLKEIAENTEKSNQSIKDDLKESIDKARQLQKDVNDLNRKLLDKKEVGWEDRKKAEELLKKEQELKKKLEEIRKANAEKNREEQEYKKTNEDILQKQEQLQSLMDKLMTPELEKLMQELQQLMEKVDKGQLQEQLGKMKQDNKDLQKELERTIELFKQMEFEQKLQDNIDKLKELADKQDALSKESEKKDADSGQLKDKQDSLNKQFDEFRKEMEDLKKKNDALEQKNDMAETGAQEQSIDQDMKNSSQQLGENKSGKASKSQKNAAQKMQQMAEQMEQQQQKNQQQQEEEDMNALRALLENLLRLSFDQEKLMQDLKTIDINNPQYLKLSQQQRKLKDDARMIEDSLFALSKRVAQIASKVNQEIGAINMNMAGALDNMEDRQVPQARSRQQFVMTSVNNLTLLLSEALQQMQQQQAQSMSQSSCKKPGQKKTPSAGELRKMQEQLNKNMQQMREQLKMQGNQKGKSQRDQGMSEQLAKMAAQQEFIRNELNKLNQQENKDGKNSLGNLQDVQNKMEETEKDIVNRMISDQTLKRQEEILSRLLESERAERERDQDEQRKSEEGKNNFQRNPSEFEEYKRIKLKEMELLRTVPPAFNQYYKQKISEYFQSLEK